MTAQEKVQELINTRINGNYIETNKTYMNMIKQINRNDIQIWNDIYGNSKKLYGNKIEMIEQITDFINDEEEV